MSDLKGRPFESEIVLWAVRWCCRYGISYRDLKRMMAEHGVTVDHSTIYRWLQKCAPKIRVLAEAVPFISQQLELRAV